MDDFSSPSLWTASFLLALIGSTTLRTWLASRQIRHVAVNRHAVPAAFAAHIPLDAHERAAAYTIARTRLVLIDTLVSAVLLLVLTLFGGLQVLWELSATIIDPAALLTLQAGVTKEGYVAGARSDQSNITLDGVDLAFIAKPLLAEQLGYLQQEGRLFEGTLRDNLLVGMTDPGDDILNGVAHQTGLHHAVLANHPMGFDLPIQEGGHGLSGGQRQLVNLTRVFLRRPRIWLMDEPTAAMDRQLADHVTRALQQALRPQDTLVLVTHKPEMLTLVDRLVVIAKHEVLLDGPKEQVLRQLQA